MAIFCDLENSCPKPPAYVRKVRIASMICAIRAFFFVIIFCHLSVFYFTGQSIWNFLSNKIKHFPYFFSLSNGFLIILYSLPSHGIVILPFLPSSARWLSVAAVRVHCHPCHRMPYHCPSKVITRIIFIP